MSAVSWKLLRQRLNLALEFLRYDPQHVQLEYHTVAGDMSEGEKSWWAMAAFMGTERTSWVRRAYGASGEDAFSNLVSVIVKQAMDAGWHCSI